MNLHLVMSSFPPPTFPHHIHPPSLIQAMHIAKTLCLFALVLATAHSARVGMPPEMQSYANHKVLRIIPSNEVCGFMNSLPMYSFFYYYCNFLMCTSEHFRSSRSPFALFDRTSAPFIIILYIPVLYPAGSASYAPTSSQRPHHIPSP